MNNFRLKLIFETMIFVDLQCDWIVSMRKCCVKNWYIVKNNMDDCKGLISFQNDGPK